MLDTPTSPTSPLFSTTPVVETSTPPVIVVGLPRSGSSFLAHTLSTLKDWYVFDDLMIYQKVQGLDIKGALTPVQLQKLVNLLGWSVKARIKHQQNYLKPQCTWEDVDKMEAAVIETFKDKDVYWNELLEEWMMRLALHHGCSHWGYKTPKDFMYMDHLLELFPGTRFVFIMRDPRKMMASKKYVHAQDGDTRDYHPLAYANYWKIAYTTVEKFKKQEKAEVFTIKFEDLVAEPEEWAEKLANFLDTTISTDVEVKTSKQNTSFEGKKRKGITDTEVWICEKMVGDTMKQAGYDLENPTPKLLDLVDLLQTSIIFLSYRIQQMLTDRSKFKTIMNYIKITFSQ